MRFHLQTGEILRVSHSGPDFLILKQPVMCPPMEAVLVVNVDGVITRYPCYLKNGIDGTRVTNAEPRHESPILAGT